MARDGSGNYSLPAGNPVATGTTVSSTTHNTTMTDVANAITASIAKDGQTTPTANLPMGTFRHTGVSSGAARDQYAAVAQLQDGGVQLVGSVTGTNTLTGSLTPAIASYVTGMQVVFIPANTNSGAATIALNGLAAKNIRMSDGNELLPADLVAGVPVVLTYTGTVFIISSRNHIAGTFTATLTGVSGTVTGTASYVRNGRMVFLTIPTMSGTSNSTSMGVSGLPAAIQPSFDQWAWGGLAANNGATVTSRTDALVNSAGGTITFALGGSTTGWTSSGTKGPNTSTICYVI